MELAHKVRFPNTNPLVISDVATGLGCGGSREQQLHFRYVERFVRCQISTSRSRTPGELALAAHGCYLALPAPSQPPEAACQILPVGVRKANTKVQSGDVLRLIQHISNIDHCSTQITRCTPCDEKSRTEKPDTINCELL